MEAGEEDEDGGSWSLAYPSNSAFQHLLPCSPQLFSSRPSLSRVVGTGPEQGRESGMSGKAEEEMRRGRKN